MNVAIPSDLQRLVDSIVALPELNRAVIHHHGDYELGRFYNYSLFFCTRTWSRKYVRLLAASK